MKESKEIREDIMNHNFQNMKVRHLFGWMLLTMVSLFIIYMVITLLDFPEILITTLPIVFFALGIYLLPVIWIWRKLNKDNASFSMFFSTDQKVQVSAILITVLILCIFVNGVNFTVHNLLTMVLPDMGGVRDDPFNIWSYLFSLFYIVIFAPICEEIIFRGFLLGRLTAKYELTVGILLSSLIFGLLHGQSLLSFTLFGVILSMIYIKTGSLIAPALIHIAFNFVQTILGYPMEQLAGPYVKTIENSLVFSLILLIIGVVLVVFYFKKNWKMVLSKGHPLL